MAKRMFAGSIVALVLGTAAVAIFSLPVETIGSRFGGIPQGLPSPHLPAFAWAPAPCTGRYPALNSMA